MSATYRARMWRHTADCSRTTGFTAALARKTLTNCSRHGIILLELSLWEILKDYQVWFGICLALVNHGLPQRQFYLPVVVGCPNWILSAIDIVYNSCSKCPSFARRRLDRVVHATPNLQQSLLQFVNGPHGLRRIDSQCWTTHSYLKGVNTSSIWRDMIHFKKIYSLYVFCNLRHISAFNPKLVRKPARDVVGNMTNNTLAMMNESALNLSAFENSLAAGLV